MAQRKKADEIVRPATVERAGATPKAAETKKAGTPKQYRVRPGHTITVGETDDDGNPKYVEYGENMTVSLTEDEAKKMPWALQPAERRTHAGQTSRLQQQIEELQAKLDASEKARKELAKSKGVDPNREDALESLRRRGDAHHLRGEPTPHVAASDTIARHNAALDDDFMSARNAGLESDDDATGIPGIARATTSSIGEGMGSAGDPLGPASRASVPSQDVNSESGVPPAGGGEE